MMETENVDCSGLPRLPVRRTVILPSGAVFDYEVGIRILETQVAQDERLESGREVVHA